MSTTLALLSLSLLTLGGPALAGPPAEDYKLVWADEFEGAELDLTKWDYRGLGPRRDAINTKDSVALDGQGNLLITTTKVGDEYHTGMIGTQGKFDPTYGYFECRVRMQKQRGHWSAFWLQSPTMTNVGDTKVNGIEIDVFEYLCNRPDLLQINLHWDGYGKDHKHRGTTRKTPGLGEGFHVIGCEWLPDRYRFFCDGVQVWQSTVAPSQRSQYIILSMEVGKWAGDIAGAQLPDSVCFDYVRAYQKAEQ